MTNVLKQIADNLGVVGYDDSSLLIGIADYYGVNTAISNNLMGDILDAVGGNASTSNNYIQDIVIALGGPSTSNNWIEEWEIITAVPPAPVNTVAPVISGTMVVGQTLTTTNGTWTNSPTSFTYKWYKGITAIVGATSSTYILVQADAGTTTAIKCEVTAINLGGSTAADSNTLTTVYDADAQAFITAAVITVLVQMTAINELTIGLKADSLWTSMKAIYPFVGGTATTHKFNLKDPRDLDAAFRLVFTGGWTHSSNGVIPNGVNAYADTKLNPLTVFGTNYAAQGSYYRETFTAAQTNMDGVCTTPFLSRFDMGYDNGFLIPFVAIASNNSTVGVDTDNKSLVLSTRQGATSVLMYRNNVLKVNSTLPFTSHPNFSYFIAARNNAGTPTLFSNSKSIAFKFISDTLSNANATNLNTRVQTFQTTLSRQV